MRNPVVFLSVFVVLACGPSHAADGDYDATWGDAGRLQIDVISPGFDHTTTMFVQPDGKLFMAGTCGASNSSRCALRLLSNGSFDPTFGPSTHLGRIYLEDSEASTSVIGAAQTPSGYVLGGFHLHTNYSAAVTYTFLDGGFAGARFDQFGGDPYLPTAFAQQPDGKLLFAGNRVSSAFSIARYLPTLSLDDQFGDSDSTKEITFPMFGHATPTAIAVQRDGKIVVVGFTGTGIAATRLLASGQLDDDPITGFGQGGIATFAWGDDGGRAEAVAIDRHENIIIAGLAKRGSDDFVINRLTPRGIQDPTFNYQCVSGPGGITCGGTPLFVDYALGGTDADAAQSIALQSDGKILVSGYATRDGGVQYFAVVRLRRNGTLDPSFGASGKTYGRYGPANQNFDFASSIAIGNGGIMLAGQTQTTFEEESRFGIAKLQLDLVFADDLE
jgi:uncharacterized delta-60 repeat protein